MKNVVSIFAGHDSNVTFYNSKTGSYHVIELERLVKKRYFRLHVDNTPDEIVDILTQCQEIAEKYWGIENDYSAVLIVTDGWLEPELLERVFNTDHVWRYAQHHHAHAAGAFYMSPFDESLIISYDGGGDDGHFNIYTGGQNGVQLVESVESDFGGGYLLCGSTIREITEKSRNPLAIAGKLMGLCAYGSPKEEWVQSFSNIFFDRNYKKLSEETNLNFKNADAPWNNPLDNWSYEGEPAYDIAATAQEAFKRSFFDVIDKYMKQFPDLPVCITGGAGLNVLVNEEMKRRYDREIYIPPNPNDCGLSVGNLFLYTRPSKSVDVTYNGLPLLDRDKLDEYVVEREARKTTTAEIASLTKDGKIIGLVYGDSEVGPRALGNRSIVCDPSILDMKDILNSKVKFREWYRPFAPFCKKEDASTYFDSPTFDNLEYMSYAPLVKEEYKEKLPSVTHVDGSSRLQTVTEESHKGFYDLLTEFGKLSDTNVLINTSFNIRGYPILSTIEDALHVLDNTEIDYVVVEDYIFSKNVFSKGLE